MGFEYSDFIYVDVPHYSGALKETYLRKYRQVYASESWKKVYSQIRESYPLSSVLFTDSVVSYFTYM